MLSVGGGPALRRLALQESTNWGILLYLYSLGKKLGGAHRYFRQWYREPPMLQLRS